VVQLRITLVDALAIAVEHLHRAERGLELLGEPELELRWRRMDGTADGRHRVIKKSVCTGG
jgi:hypothetical protein